MAQLSVIKPVQMVNTQMIQPSNVFYVMQTVKHVLTIQKNVRHAI